MAGNVIYRGPVAKEPQTINLPTAGAYLPGIFVKSNGTVLTQATVGTGKNYLLGNLNFKDQDIVTAYASGDTAVAFDCLPGEVYNARMAAATYTKGQELTIDATGRLAAAVATNVVVAVFDGPTTALTAGTFADVIIANSYTKP